MYRQDSKTVTLSCGPPDVLCLDAMEVGCSLFWTVKLPLLFRSGLPLLPKAFREILVRAVCYAMTTNEAGISLWGFVTHKAYLMSASAVSPVDRYRKCTEIVDFA